MVREVYTYLLPQFFWVLAGVLTILFFPFSRSVHSRNRLWPAVLVVAAMILLDLFILVAGDAIATWQRSQELPLWRILSVATPSHLPMFLPRLLNLVAGSTVLLLLIWRTLAAPLSARKPDPAADPTRLPPPVPDQPQGVWHIGPQGDPLWVDAGLARMFGCDSEQELLTWMTQPEHPPYAEPEARVAFLQELARSGAVAGAEFRVRRKDGVVIRVVEHARAVRDRKSRLLHYEGLVQNLTERRRAENALRESEKKFRDLVEGSIQGIAVHRKGKLLFVNKACAEIYGYSSPEEMLALDSIRLTQAEEEQARLQAYDEARMRGEPASPSQMLRGVCKDGSYIWINYLSNVIDWEGEPATLVTLYETTAQRQFEEALLRSEKKFRHVIESSVQGIVIHRNREPLFVNQAFADIFGYESTASAMALATIDPLITPEERERVHAYGAARMRGEPAPAFYEFLGQRKDGTRIWVYNFSNVIEWEGQPALLTTLYDITEFKQATEELRESERRYLDLIEQASDGVLVFDQTGALRDTNTAAQEIFGYTRKEILHLNVRDLVAPADLAERPLLYQRIGSGEKRTLVRRMVRKNRSVFPGEISFRVLENGTVLAFLRDITERRELEAQLLQAQKMEAIGQLTGGVAHDFNNLLSIIMGNLELLELETQDQPRIRKLLDRSLDATSRAASLTQRLLAFSRKQLLQPRPTELNRLIASLSEMLRRSLGETIEVVTRLDPAIGQILVDPSQLETALLNLAINARDAMCEGGQLVIQTQTLRLDPESAALKHNVQPGDYVMLVVKDTGSGMSPEVKDRAFEPFFTTKDVGRGSGLGLSMVYGFVNQTGGHVEIDSEPGRGAAVKILLPQARTGGPVVEDDSTLEQDLRGRGETILVVEDDPQVCQLTVSMLTRLGYHPLAAGDAEAALDLFERMPQIRLLFTDVVLPGKMNGVALAEDALGRRPELRVLFTSGYPRTALGHYGRSMTEVELIDKPYKKADLARRLRYLLEEDPS